MQKLFINSGYALLLSCSLWFCLSVFAQSPIKTDSDQPCDVVKRVQEELHTHQDGSPSSRLPLLTLLERVDMSTCNKNDARSLLLLKGEVLSDLFRFGAAVRAFEQADALQSNAETLIPLAEAYLNHYDYWQWDKCMNSLASKENPDKLTPDLKSRWLLLRGHSYLSLGNLERGLALIKQADAIYSSGATLSWLDYAYFVNHHSAESQECFRKCLRLINERRCKRNDAWWLYVQQGVKSLEKQQIREAEALYQQANRYRNDDYANTYMAGTFYNKNKIVHMERYFDKVISLNEKHQCSPLMLWWLYLLRGNVTRDLHLPETADLYYRQAEKLVLQSGGCGQVESLAGLYSNLGDKKRALFYITKGLALFDAGKATIQSMIQLLSLKTTFVTKTESTADLQHYIPSTIERCFDDAQLFSMAQSCTQYQLQSLVHSCCNRALKLIAEKKCSNENLMGFYQLEANAALAENDLNKAQKVLEQASINMPCNPKFIPSYPYINSYYCQLQKAYFDKKLYTKALTCTDEAIRLIAKADSLTSDSAMIASMAQSSLYWRGQLLGQSQSCTESSIADLLTVRADQCADTAWDLIKHIRGPLPDSNSLKTCLDCCSNLASTLSGNRLHSCLDKTVELLQSSRHILTKTEVEDRLTELLLSKARHMMEQNQLPEAVHQLTQIGHIPDRRLAESLLDLYIKIAQRYYKLGRIGEANACAATVYNKARAEKLSKQRETALLLRVEIALARGEPATHFLSELIKSTNIRTVSDTAALILSAPHYLGEAQACLMQFQTLAEKQKSPGNLRTAFQLQGHFFHGCKKYREAIRGFTEADKLHRDAPNLGYLVHALSAVPGNEEKQLEIIQVLEDLYKSYQCSPELMSEMLACKSAILATSTPHRKPDLAAAYATLLRADSISHSFGVSSGLAEYAMRTGDLKKAMQHILMAEQQGDLAQNQRDQLVTLELRLAKMMMIVGGNYAAVQALTTKVLAAKGSDFDALILLGKTYEDTGEYQKAIQLYTKAVKLRSPSNWLSLSIAKCLAKQNRYSEAISALEAECSTPHLLPECLCERATLYLHCNKPDLARNDLHTLQEHFPERGYSALTLQLGRIKYCQNIAQFKSVLAAIPTGDKTKIEQLSTSIASEQNSKQLAQLLTERAEAKLRLGKFEQALSDADKAISYQAQSIQAHAARASALNALKRLDEAQEERKMTVKLFSAQQQLNQL